MNTQETTNTYTKEQNFLIAEFAATYDIDPDQISFFDDDPQPFFDRDATAVLINRLIGPAGVEDDLVASPSPNTIAVKYRITLEDGSFGSSTGVANLDEQKDDKPMSPTQIQSLATARAARGALRNRAIDLVKLHYIAQAKANGSNVATPKFSGPPRSERETLLRQVHALGNETGLITDRGAGKVDWYNLLAVRYNVRGSSELTDYLLKDFAAHLNTLPKVSTAAA